MLEFAAPGGGEGGVPFAGGPVLSGLAVCGGDAGLPDPALLGGAGVVVVEPSGLVEVEEPSAQFSTTGPFGVEDTEVMPTPLASLVPGGNVVVEEPPGLVEVEEPSAQFSTTGPFGVEDTEVMPTPLASLVPGGNVVVEEPPGLVVVVEPSAQCCVVVPSGAIVVPGGGFGAGVDAD